MPLIDMFLFLFEKIDQGIVTLDAEAKQTLDSLRGELERGEAQLRGENASLLGRLLNPPRSTPPVAQSRRR